MISYVFENGLRGAAMTLALLMTLATLTSVNAEQPNVIVILTDYQCLMDASVYGS